MNTRPDTASALAGLKDFQRATVDYVFDRFYGSDPTRRFLVADEVGLGKTLVARGVIARGIDHLWEKSDRPINIVYICSNTDIARQNIARLRVPGCSSVAQATRLTLLPLSMPDADQPSVPHQMNLMALTPSTSFEQTSGGGRVDERVLLYWLLDRAWGIHGSKSSLYVMQEYAPKSFEWYLHRFDPKKLSNQLADEFVASLTKQMQAEREAGAPDLRMRFEELRKVYCRSDSRVPPEANRQRSRWIGELRRVLARVCLASLRPDIIVLDEFQRFKQLLEEDSEAGELARDLFDSDSSEGARVLLLSATPYRSLTLHHETDDDHYQDFMKLLGFLEEKEPLECSQILAEYRAALPTIMTAQGKERMRAAQLALQRRLSKVMVRTERFSSKSMRDGMLVEVSTMDAALQPNDVRAFLGAQSVADAVREGDVVEYWKSAPYLFNFMDDYALKKSFKNTSEKGGMVKIIRQFPETFLDLEQLRNYLPLEPGNVRLRDLISQTVDRGTWRLLWMPAALPYYAPDGPYADPKLANITKRLVFSAWHMVPRAVSSLLSYEAERRMMRAARPRASITQEDRKKQRGLLRFRISENRHAGMPLLLLVYPCLTFARDCDPRTYARANTMTATEVLARFASTIQMLIQDLGVEYESGGVPDDRWYWVAPMLLDLSNFPEAAKEWWERPDLTQRWAGIEVSAEDDAWASHVELARQTIDAIPAGKMKLGPPPEDLFNVLALAASAGPATAAIRAYARTSASDPAASIDLRDTAAVTGRAFLTLFNHAEVIEMVRTEYPDGPYWERALRYAHAGGLQAVLDEYTHLLRESLSVSSLEPGPMAARIGEEVISAMTIRTASLRIDNVTAPPYAREAKLEPEPMRIRYAMRFGDDRADEETTVEDGGTQTTRKERVRSAFNSPFWPFVLVSTSIGQEGLDFHYYCHAVTHWNLPSNPVDLEQREGRIHRYKGHAVRKNVAASFGSKALQDSDPDGWNALFEQAKHARCPGENDLIPYWLFQGDAKIERHVPVLPLSRDRDRLSDLRRSLAIYRMVFGQSRQEDLIEFLLLNIPEDGRDALARELQIDLSPPIPPGAQAIDLQPLFTPEAHGHESPQVMLRDAADPQFTPLVSDSMQDTR